jgi:hypothetical protein
MNTTVKGVFLDNHQLLFSVAQRKQWDCVSDSPSKIKIRNLKFIDLLNTRTYIIRGLLFRIWIRVVARSDCICTIFPRNPLVKLPQFNSTHHLALTTWTFMDWIYVDFMKDGEGIEERMKSGRRSWERIKSGRWFVEVVCSGLEWRCIAQSAEIFPQENGLLASNFNEKKKCDQSKYLARALFVNCIWGKFPAYNTSMIISTNGFFDRTYCSQSHKKCSVLKIDIVNA